MGKMRAMKLIIARKQLNLSVVVVIFLNFFCLFLTDLYIFETPPPCARPNSEHREEILASLIEKSNRILHEHDPNMPAWLMYGSLLGAVREGHVIPWTSDSDMGMWREHLRILCDPKGVLYGKFEDAGLAIYDCNNNFARVCFASNAYSQELEKKKANNAAIKMAIQEFLNKNNLATENKNNFKLANDINNNNINNNNIINDNANDRIANFINNEEEGYFGNDNGYGGYRDVDESHFHETTGSEMIDPAEMETGDNKSPFAVDGFVDNTKDIMKDVNNKRKLHRAIRTPLKEYTHHFKHRRRSESDMYGIEWWLRNQLGHVAYLDIYGIFSTSKNTLKMYASRCSILKSWIFPLKNYTINGFTVLGPNNEDAILSLAYGLDYMTPVKSNGWTTDACLVRRHHLSTTKK